MLALKWGRDGVVRRDQITATKETTESMYPIIYRTNCDVVQIFPTMSKAVATREKIRLFFTCV